MEKRKDDKGRVLHTGESQRSDKTYMFRYVDLDNIRKSVYAKSLNELRKKEKIISDRLSQGIYDEKLTMNQVFDRFIKQKTNVKPRVRFAYQTFYNRWVRNTWFGQKPIKDIVKSDVVIFYDEKKRSGLSNSSIQNIHKTIGGAMQMAYDDNIIAKNCASDCCKMYKKTEPRKALTKEETEKFFTEAESYLHGRIYLVMYKLMLYTGMRVGEITGLTWNDIDMDNKIIDINHQFVLGDGNSRNSYHIDGTKTKKGNRKIPMIKEAYELLAKYRDDTKSDEAIYSNVSVDGYSNFVFHTQSGLPIITPTLSKYCRCIVKRYNESHEDKLPNISCHTFRHTFCTRMAELGMNPNTLQKIMGHGSYELTANVYISINDDFAIKNFTNTIDGVSSIFTP